MGEGTSWVVEGAGRAGQILVEILSGVSGDVLSIETPGWSFAFHLLDDGVAAVHNFLQAHSGRAEFAECVVGSFFGQPVWLINDAEFSDRLWLRMFGAGALADFPLVGEGVGWLVAAVAEAHRKREQAAS